MKTGARWMVGVVASVLLMTGCSKQDANEIEPEAAHEPPAPAPDRSSLSNEAPPWVATWPNPNSPTADPLAWNRQSLGEVYQTKGTRNPAWDEPALALLDAFAHQRSGIDTNATYPIKELSRKAIDAGCNDPMVTYLGIRAIHGGWDDADEERANRYLRCAEALAASEYPPIRKFYAWLRAAQAWKSAHQDPGSGGVYGPLRRNAFRELCAVLQDPSTPEAEALDASEQLIDVAGSNAHHQDEFLPTLIDYYGKRWPDSPGARTLRGRCHVELAWNRRSGKYAGGVTDDGWKGFEMHLAGAEKDLEMAWRLDPQNVQTALLMMRVELGQGKGLVRLNQWFDRAMKLDPNNFDAVTQKAWYLQPKWYGSDKQALAFARRCVASREWKGRVPLILLDTHVMLAGDRASGLKDAHWTQPGVWKDVKASFDRFFELNPEATGWRHNYALYAFKCREFNVFLDLLPTLGHVNASYFGGDQEFENMIRTAENTTGRTAPRPAIQESGKK